MQMNKLVKKMPTERRLATKESSELNISYFENYRFKVEESQEDIELNDYLRSQCD